MGLKSIKGKFGLGKPSDPEKESKGKASKLGPVAY